MDYYMAVKNIVHFLCIDLEGYSCSINWRWSGVGSWGNSAWNDFEGCHAKYVYTYMCLHICVYTSIKNIKAIHHTSNRDNL